MAYELYALLAFRRSNSNKINMKELNDFLLNLYTSSDEIECTSNPAGCHTLSSEKRMCEWGHWEDEVKH